MTISKHGYAVYKSMSESGREVIPTADRKVYAARLAEEKRAEQLREHDRAGSPASEFEEAKIAERVKALTGNGWPKEVNYLGARALVLELELNESFERIKALEKEIRDMHHPLGLCAALNDR